MFLVDKDGEKNTEKNTEECSEEIREENAGESHDDNEPCPSDTFYHPNAHHNPKLDSQTG